SCGNSNFARRTECNKCSTPCPTAAKTDRGGESGNGYNRGGGGYSGSRGSRDGSYESNRSGSGGGGGGGGSRGGSYGGSQVRGDDDAYNQVPPPAAAPAYGNAGGSYAAPPSSYGGSAIPPPTSYTGGPASYPPSYGAPVSGYGEAAGGRGGPPGGYGGGSKSQGGGGYGASTGSGDPPAVKQCDENCDDTCDNSRIYISNLPADVTVEELQELFGGIGQVGKIKQKRGYKDQWPWNIKIYTDEKGNNKGDAVLSYEDPSAAHSAGGFYNNYDMRGQKISVVMAEKTALRAPDGYCLRSFMLFISMHISCTIVIACILRFTPHGLWIILFSSL
ncbi:Transcription initiation factor TFIID subunit 15b, partial [Linum perenne]